MTLEEFFKIPSQNLYFIIKRNGERVVSSENMKRKIAYISGSIIADTLIITLE